MSIVIIRLELLFCSSA